MESSKLAITKCNEIDEKIKSLSIKGGNLADLPPPTRGNYDHYVECKYCGRKYAKEVA